MRYAQIRKMDISNGPGVGVALFTQGCSIHCPGCHNSSIWDFEGGKEFTQKTKNTIIELLEPKHITRLSILGGEPLAPENIEGVLDLILSVKNTYLDKSIWVYTGYTYENLLKKAETNSKYALSFYGILLLADVLVDGPFIQDKKDITLAFKGSSNQRLINLNKTRLHPTKISLLSI